MVVLQVRVHIFNYEQDLCEQIVFLLRVTFVL